MSEVKLLDCTLRDGGYINGWDFTPEQISSVINNLTKAGIDYIEIGYLTSIFDAVNGSQFQTVESASCFLPEDRKQSKLLVMADVTQFDTKTLCPKTADVLDGIRVVFYKRQIEQAYTACERIVEMGYDLFLQPMVTIDYSLQEFDELIQRFYERYHPYAVSIVDSFGCMVKSELFKFIGALEKIIDKDVKIGFHGHDNMQLSQINAISLFDYGIDREFVIDASVSGMGRGAGNLYTELIANYCNMRRSGRYDLDYILRVASEVTEPISRANKWGYSPYFMLTAQHRAHPNFATYLLANHDVSVNDFAEYLRQIPVDMLTKCTKPYVEKLYQQFINRRR
jgi:4-hydroxy 2-oxovalerate aldolase